MNAVYLVLSLLILLIIIIGSIRRSRFYPDKFLLLIILLFFLPGLARVFPANFMDIFSNESFTWPFVIGMAVGYPISRWLNRVSGFSTFEHELTHAFVAVLFFKRITRFVVTKNSGGYVEYSGGIQSKTANHLITLAPYYLPLFLFLFVLIRPFLSQKFFPYYDGWLGLWFTFYLMTWYEEIKRNSSSRPFRAAGSGQYSFSDITSEGHVFSFTFIVTFTLLIYNVIFTILENGYRGFHSLFLSVWERSVWFYTQIFHALEQFINH